jgi:hypothetical protein
MIPADIASVNAMNARECGQPMSVRRKKRETLGTHALAASLQKGHVGKKNGLKL